jgi:phytoene synthase
MRLRRGARVAVMAIPYPEALAQVRAKVNASRTSFHAGMALLPKARREGMYALYAFCREVDDIADDSPTPEEGVRGLRLWRQRIASLFQGRPDDAITSALAPAVRDFGLVEADFQAIIDGMAMDAGGVAAAPICAPDMKTLDLYCDRVASAVGRISVRIFGDSSAKGMDVAHHLGRAFQFTNILRDLAEDAVRGRLYLPKELLEKHGITATSPMDVIYDVRLRDVCRDFAALTRAYFDAADQAMRAANPAAMRPARVMRAYYGAIFDRLVADDWRHPGTRVNLPKWQKFWLVLRHLVG